MNSSRIEIMGVILAMLGLIFAIITCALPNWIMYSDSNTAQAFEYILVGLWKVCVKPKIGLKVCSTVDDPSLLTADMQAGRGLIIICIMLSILALLAVFAGSNFTSFIKNEDLKPKVRMGAEIALLLAGLFLLIPIIWSSTTNGSINDLLTHGARVEKGACLYTGWVGAVFLLLAGGLLFWNRRNPNVLQQQSISPQ